MSISTQYRAAADLLEAEYLESERVDDIGNHLLLTATTVGKLLTMVRDLTATLDSARLARLTRPNGRAYRATKPAEVTLIDDVVVVLRTHDVDVAVSVASLKHPEVTRESTTGLLWLSSHVSRSQPGRVFYEDAEHGVPAVVFHA